MAVIAPPRQPDSHDAVSTVEPDRGGETLIEASTRARPTDGVLMAALQPSERKRIVPLDMWTEQPGIGRLGVGFLPFLPHGVPECACVA
ncbi:MAG: hypothetical protein HOQ00_03380 [Agromyces sp.]|nr:hypothetical protein [Agromyces sp.]